MEIAPELPVLYLPQNRPALACRRGCDQAVLAGRAEGGGTGSGWELSAGLSDLLCYGYASISGLLAGFQAGGQIAQLSLQLFDAVLVVLDLLLPA